MAARTKRKKGICQRTKRRPFPAIAKFSTWQSALAFPFRAVLPWAGDTVQSGLAYDLAPAVAFAQP